MALWFFGIRQPGVVAAGLLVCVVSALAWFEHHKSGENFFHASLGANIWISVAASAAFIALLEVVI